MKYKVNYTDASGTRITEFVRTESAAKKIARRMGGTWAKLLPGE